MRVVVGLGNPGPQYVITRHNAGFLVVDALAKGWELPPWRQEDNALVTGDEGGPNPLTLVKPLTFMNLSGDALPRFIDEAGFQHSSDLLVIADDFALPFGTFRLRGAGSSGGHKGLQSIEDLLDSQDYARLRVGIGPLPPGEGDDRMRSFVMAPFSPRELEGLGEMMPDLAEAVECWAFDGIEVAMSRFNSRGAEE